MPEADRRATGHVSLIHGRDPEPSHRARRTESGVAAVTRRSAREARERRRAAEARPATPEPLPCGCRHRCHGERFRPYHAPQNARQRRANAAVLAYREVVRARALR